MPGEHPQAKVTPYLIYLVLITTLGPLQFGYHLVLRTHMFQLQV